MNNKALTLSVVMAIIAVFFVQSYVTSIEDEAKKKFGTEVLVVVARKDIKDMETLNETAFEFKNIPKRFLEPAAVSFTDTEENDQKRKEVKLKLSGSVALVPIKKGEQVTFNKITEPSIRTGLSPQIEPGKRAIAIPVTEISGVGKLIKPGDRVDVIAVVATGDKKETRIARTVLQDTPVLAVGKYVSNNVPRTVEYDSNGKERVTSLANFEGFNNITIEVEPQQAQMMALLVADGSQSFTITLRNTDDNARPVSGVTGYGDLFNGARVPAGGVR